MTATPPVSNKLVTEDFLVRENDSTQHNLISGNIFAALHRHLRGKPEKVFINAMKVKPWAQFQLVYHPDIVVACGPDGHSDRFIRRPKVIIEVISESTRSTDAREKLLSYLQIASLEEYVLVEQNLRYFVIYRRSNNWRAEECAPTGAILPLHSLGFSMLLSEVYEGVTFAS